MTILIGGGFTALASVLTVAVTMLLKTANTLAATQSEIKDLDRRLSSLEAVTSKVSAVEQDVAVLVANAAHATTSMLRIEATLTAALNPPTLRQTRTRTAKGT